MNTDTNTPVETPFVKKADLARAIGASGRTVDEWVSRRMIPYIAVSPRMHLFDIEDVKAALKRKYGVDAAIR
jgi:hypothetical protein